MTSSELGALLSYVIVSGLFIAAAGYL